MSCMNYITLSVPLEKHTRSFDFHKVLKLLVCYVMYSLIALDSGYGLGSIREDYSVLPIPRHHEGYIICRSPWLAFTSGYFMGYEWSECFINYHLSRYSLCLRFISQGPSNNDNDRGTYTPPSFWRNSSSHFVTRRLQTFCKQVCFHGGLEARCK